MIVLVLCRVVFLWCGFFAVSTIAGAMSGRVAGFPQEGRLDTVSRELRLGLSRRPRRAALAWFFPVCRCSQLWLWQTFPL